MRSAKIVSWRQPVREFQHRCQDSDCIYFGQPTSPNACKCHKSADQMMRDALAEAGKAAITLRNELDRTRAERDSWEAQFHSAAAAASEYSEFWEKHHDTFGKLTEQAQAERGSLDAAKQAIELAYGLLWGVGCDRSTKNGNALYLARKALYERLDRDGQTRGITAAREALDAVPPLPAYDDPNFKYNEATGSYHRIPAAVGRVQEP